MRKGLAPLLAVALLLAAIPAGASENVPTNQLPKGLNAVRSATADFRRVASAEAAGYVEFLDCFDSPDGGMGQHYVDLDALDGKVQPTHPEAMVYEVGDSGLRLVAVEYIVPSAFVDPDNPPKLFGNHFHLNAALDVWVLHAWIWKWNPSGMFADWNPRVSACPSS